MLKNKKIRFTKKKDERILPILFNFFFYFPLKVRIKIIISFVLSLFSGLLESISFALVIPFILTLISPDSLLKSEFINRNLQFLLSLPLNRLIFLFFIALLITNILSACFKRFILKYTLDLAANIGILIAKDTFSGLLKRNFLEFKASSKGDDINLLVNQVNNSVGFMSNALFLLSGIISSLIIVSAVFLISFKISFLTIIIFIGLYLLIGSRANIKLTKIGTNQVRSTNKYVRLINESLGSYRWILLMDLSQFFTNKVAKVAKEFRYDQAQNQFLLKAPKFSIELIALTTISTVSYYIYLNSENPLKALSLMSAVALALQKLLPNLQLSYSSWARMVSGKFMVNNIYPKLLKSKKYNSNFEKGTKKNIEKIEFKNLELSSVCFNFPNGKNSLLENINFKIEKGEFIGFIGKSGGGKSTLFDLIMGFIEPSNGKILLNNLDLYKNKDSSLISSWKRSISLVPQEIYLFNSTISENIAFFTKPKDIDFKKIIDICKIVQLDQKYQDINDIFMKPVGDNGNFLSGGEKQRLALARALYYQPEVLFLDEATSGLDAKIENNLLVNIRKNYPNLTILMISHNEKLSKFFDRSFLLKDGHLYNV